MEKNKKDNLVEASWELFFKTGDPFYLMAKNSFEEDQKTKVNKTKHRSKENGENNNNKGDMP